MKDFVGFLRLSSARASRSSSAAPAYLFAILLTLVSLVSPAQARPTDSTAGSVHGTVSVIDPNGQSYGAPGAQVRLIGPARDACQLAIADDSGQYKFDSVPPGSYQLEVTLDGFEKLTSQLTIHAGEEILENIKLLLKGAQEEYTVKAERVGLSLRDAGPAPEMKQQTSQTDPLRNERLREAARNVKGSLASHGVLEVNSSVAGYNVFGGSSGRHFLSTPNQMVRLPKFFSPRIQVLKSRRLSVSPKVSLGNQHHGRGPQFPDVQGSFPRDFQGNLAGTNFGIISNGVGRMFGIRFVIEKK